MRRGFVIVGIAVVAVAAIIAVVLWRGREPAAPQAAHKLEAPPAASVAVPAVPAAPATASETDKPSFDIVRVDPGGNAVLAGRAAPGSEVTVYDGAAALGKVTADAQGNWVLVPGKPLDAGRRELTLSATGKDGAAVKSDGVVAMLVPDRGPPAPVASNAAVEPAKSSEVAPPEAVAVLLPKEGAAKSLQLPPLKNGERLSLNIIEYGNGGGMNFQGRTVPGAKVGISLGDKKIGEATADQSGQWSLDATEDVPPGHYRLKLEAQDPSGKKLAQLSMPFERAAVPAEIASEIVTVQPGNSLWRIAKHSYGKGVRYVEIYQANRDRIHNPDLIFPGQLLSLPDKS
jgi:nucleoid-associated protein YgaU